MFLFEFIKKKMIIILRKSINYYLVFIWTFEEGGRRVLGLKSFNLQILIFSKIERSIQFQIIQIISRLKQTIVLNEALFLNESEIKRKRKTNLLDFLWDN